MRRAVKIVLEHAAFTIDIYTPPWDNKTLVSQKYL